MRSYNNHDLIVGKTDCQVRFIVSWSADNELYGIVV